MGGIQNSQGSDPHLHLPAALPHQLLPTRHLFLSVFSPHPQLPHLFMITTPFHHSLHPPGDLLLQLPVYFHHLIFFSS